MCEMLETRGASVIEFPTIRIEPPSDPLPLQQAISKLHTFDQIIFTSVNGVKYFWKYFDGTWPTSVRVAAIGPATAAAITARGVTPDFVPSKYVAETLAEELGPVEGQTILLPRASKTRPILAELLQIGGAKVTSVTAYETQVNYPPDSAYAELTEGIDAVTFTSGSTVDGFKAVSPDPEISFIAACIGPITAKAALLAGFKVGIIAKTYTSKGLVTALDNYFEQLAQT